MPRVIDIGGLNVKGYHFHFIADERSKGGHLLDVSFDSAAAFVDQTDGFFMTLSPSTPEGTVTMSIPPSMPLLKNNQIRSYFKKTL